MEQQHATHQRSLHPDSVRPHAERGRSVPPFGASLVRALGGAIIFSFPLLMTMEMWWLGFSMDRDRLILLLLVITPLLGGLSYHGGFEENVHWIDHVLDPFVAYAVGYCTSTVMLALFGVINPSMPIAEIIGKISLQAVPASMGAMLARSQFGIGETRDSPEHPGATYAWDLFLRAVGALFLAFTAAPTEEIVLIAYQITAWQAIMLALVSLLIMHLFITVGERREHSSVPPETPVWQVFLRFTVVGYALVLLISLYILWTFGRTEGTALEQIVKAMVVLGFPATLGAGAARLIL